MSFDLAVRLSFVMGMYFGSPVVPLVEAKRTGVSAVTWAGSPRIAALM